MKFDKKEAAGQPLPFSAPKNPQWVMLAALLLSYAAGYEYVDRCLGFGVASEYSAWRAGVLVFVALYTVVVELAARAGDRHTTRTTAEALPDIIRWYADNGYTFLTVAEALPLN